MGNKKRDICGMSLFLLDYQDSNLEEYKSYLASVFMVLFANNQEIILLSTLYQQIFVIEQISGCYFLIKC